MPDAAVQCPAHLLLTSVRDQIALIRPPDAQLAPGFRDSLSKMSHFSVTDMGGGILAVAPAEGAGATTDHFTLAKICDADTDLQNPATWESLRKNPPRQSTDEDPDAFFKRMLDAGARVRERRDGVEGDLVAFRLAVMGAGQAGRLPEIFTTYLPALFEQFPNGSLWQVSVSDVLIARMTFARAQLALQLTPDIPLGDKAASFDGCSSLGLTGGVDFAGVVSVPLLALSPAVLGLIIASLPHQFVFCFGDAAELRCHPPVSFAAMYRPGVLSDPEGLGPLPALSSLESQDGPTMLNWWVGRLNRLYSHVADPTRFTDSDGFHDASAQMAWLITLERLLGDALSLLAEPQASDLHRAQTAFDLLDKAESLLGYGKRESGKGFQALLRRRQTIRRLRQAYTSLPDGLARRLGDEAQRLFDGLYSHVRENTAAFRLRKNGADIANDAATSLRAIDDETLISSLLRAARNSSHGLLEILHTSNDRFLLAANTGAIPAELSALAPLIALGIVADAEGLIDGTWRRNLAQQGKS